MKTAWKKHHKSITVFIILFLLISLSVGSYYVYESYKKQQALEEQENYYKYTVNASPEELANQKIDEYNFEQLEKAKPFLDGLSKDVDKFFTLREFNEITGANIQPIHNCYYVSNRNGDEPYMFGFQLESEKYRDKYSEKSKKQYMKISNPEYKKYNYLSYDYYAYPKYDRKPTYFCGGAKMGCGYDSKFIYKYYGKTL
ncbi:hypothetical protein MK079_00220 [Candidatus Gracilibacteria bacterium]|nr:hypothetical protein [Candidatus Gracilibacteria bacterium]